MKTKKTTSKNDKKNVVIRTAIKAGFGGIEVRTPVLHASTPAGMGKVMLG